MNPELRDRSIMVALLLIAWAVLVYLKTVLNEAVLPDLNAIIAQVQVLMGGVVGYHVGTGAGSTPASAPAAAPALPKAAGLALPSFVHVLVVLAVLSYGLLGLTGCASLTQAGNTAYSVKPVIVDGKATGGCEFNATDGKEYSARAMAMSTAADGCSLMVNEGASSAFQGQAIAGKALTVLPSFAPLILAPGPASAVPQLQGKP